MAFENHPLLIELGELECCALAAIFLTRQELLTEEELFLTGIFVHTAGLGFIPNERMKEAYLSLCTKEIERLSAEKNFLLFCDHSREEHLKGLSAVCAILVGRTFSH